MASTIDSAVIATDSAVIDLHQDVKDKLTYFIQDNKIPHILFHGPFGSGKRTIVYKFVADIYNNDKNLIKNYTLFADCAYGKGIKFIREELKFFAKTNVNIKGIGHFKTIILTNADKLTTDAQSALRRCIEIFSHNTRFFIIVENKYSLLKPILSRLCEIYICKNPAVINTAPKHLTDQANIRTTWLAKEIEKWNGGEKKNNNIIKLSNKLYEKGYSGIDLMDYLEHIPTLNAEIALKNYTHLMLFDKVKTEFRSEKLFMTFILALFYA